MPTHAEERFGHLIRVAQRAGRRAALLSGGILDAEDATQEALLWLVANPKQVERCVGGDGTLYQDALYHYVMDHRIKRWVQSEVKHALRMDPREQAYYTREKVVAYLPSAWVDEGHAPVSETGIRVATDHATSGTLRAVAADLQRAIKAVVSARDVPVLFARYALGQTWAEVGASCSAGTERAARGRAERAVEDMVDFLNGLRPVPDDGPGTRRPISNAAARAITDRGGEAADAVSHAMS